VTDAPPFCLNCGPNPQADGPVEREP